MIDKIYDSSKPSLKITRLDVDGDEISDDIVIECKTATNASEIKQAEDTNRLGESVSINLISEDLPDIRTKLHLIAYFRAAGEG